MWRNRSILHSIGHRREPLGVTCGAVEEENRGSSGAAGPRLPKRLEFARQNPIAPGRGTVTARVALEGKITHIPDVLADAEFTGNEYIRRDGVVIGKFRSALGVPLLREGKTIGVFVLTRRARTWIRIIRDYGMRGSSPARMPGGDGLRQLP